MEQYLVRTRELTYLTQTTVELTVDLVLPDYIKFEAGQYMNFKIGNQVQTFTILSVPDHNTELKFLANLSEQGPGSEFVKTLRKGKEFYITGPEGSFAFEDYNRNALFIAWGISVAPFVSIIPDMLSKGYAHHVQLLFGLNSEEDVFYFDRFRHMASVYQNFTFTPVLSLPQSHWPGETGRISSYISIHYQQLKETVAYLSGPKDLVQESGNLLLKLGHKREDLKAQVL